MRSTRLPNKIMMICYTSSSLYLSCFFEDEILDFIDTQSKHYEKIHKICNGNNIGDITNDGFGRKRIKYTEKRQAVKSQI